MRIMFCSLLFYLGLLNSATVCLESNFSASSMLLQMDYPYGIC